MQNYIYRVVQSDTYYWDTGLLTWVVGTQPGGGGGGAGDASAANQVLQIAALGATTDAEAAGDGSIIALLKRLRTLLAGGLPAVLAAGGGLKVEGVAGGVVVPVSDGAGSLTIDSPNLDVALSTRLKAADTLAAVTTVGTITNVVHVDDNAGSLTVDAPVATPVFVRLSDGAAAIATLPVSAATLPLPTGASTLAEQQTQTTSLALIDDIIYGNDAAISKAGLICAQFDDTAPGTTTENNTRALRMSTRRELYNQIRDAAGNERGLNIDANGRAGVDLGTVAGGTALLTGAGVTGTGSPRVTIATDGQGQLVDNAGFTDGTTRLDMSGHIFDEVAGTALTENDAAASRIDSKRAQVMVVEDATTRGQRQVVTATGAASVNLARILDVALSVGAGSTGTGVQRVAEASCATGTQSSVAGTVTANTTILAANTARRGASVFNDSTAVLTLALGGTQSATVFAVKLASQQYFEVPAGYNGAITGSWATATGSARVMEYT